MKFKFNPKNQIQCSTLHSLALLSIFILLFCKHGSVSGETLSNQTDYLALLEFRHHISNDPNGFFKSWNNSHHFCKWQGVKCGVKHQRVVILMIEDQHIFGTISPHIGNLSFLRVIFLQGNNFHGQIPQQIGQLVRLRHLVLSNNTIGGRLPTNLSRCSNLIQLFLNNNCLLGSIPEELGSLKMLRRLQLGQNNLTGFIPRSLGNLSSITHLSISQNNLEGTIPNELGQLTTLSYIAVDTNNLTGALPSFIYNNISTTIKVFEVLLNKLTGSLPFNIGLTLPNLQEFYCEANSFQGGIPVSFSNASHLEILALSTNMFTGPVPRELGRLKHLRWLNLEKNFLGSNTTNDLSFIASLSNSTNLESLYIASNNLGGEIPSTIWNFSDQLQQLYLGANYLIGSIPPVHENHDKLIIVELSFNLLSGSIPSSLGKLRNLQFLASARNNLSGRIPHSLGNISQLYALDFSYNNLEGNIPESLGNCQFLSYMDLSQNRLIGYTPVKIFNIFSILSLNLSGNMLIGSLPTELSKLKNIASLDVSDNNFTGNIPSSIGECLSLEYLLMQGNFFQGVIPPTLTNLKGMQRLDLSRNNLSGRIPVDMAKLPFLSYLNLSFNNLEGEVPNTGPFDNATVVSVLGNSKLCGGIRELELKPCGINVKKPRLSPAVKITIIAFGGVCLLILIIGLFLSRRKSKKALAPVNSIVENILRVSYYELYRATEGFSSRNLIGSGSFGSVYKGELNQKASKLVAVKVFNLEKSGASKSFVAECRSLRNIRHRNLVKILTYCSSIDSKHNQFNALVYEFMANGSLDMWLHPHGQESSRSLSLLQRVNVAVDVANAIHYLHDLCEPCLIHCDLKPSNILLDNEFLAHVSDFGLARLLSKSADNFIQEQCSSMGIKGSIGYAAPEYGMGGEASKSGDVYSYGVLILEMMTRRRPTDEIFKDGLNLRNYVKTAFEEKQVMMIVDATLVATGEAETEALEDNEQKVYENQIVADRSLQNCVFAVLKIGLECSADSPKERMCMSQVLMELRHIKAEFLGE